VSFWSRGATTLAGSASQRHHSVAVLGEVIPHPDRTDAPGVLLTKLHAPVVREQTVRRERLLELLRAGADRKLTLVAAPAGSGKSTLLADWSRAEAPTRPVAWLSLDDGDNDPLVLWLHAIEALGRISPAVGRSAAPALSGSATIVDVVLPRLVNDLADEDGIVLILDDFHRLTSGPARDSVAWFVEHSPATVQVVVATRSEPALPLPAMRAHGELLELRAGDLRFTSAEVETFLNGRLGLGLSGEDVELLTKRTEGWPAGVYLAALSLTQPGDRHAFVSRFGASSRHVVEFMAEEVLEAHGPAVQTLMVRCSILDRLCGPLCGALLERDDAADMLDALSRTNLFLIPLDDRGQWYRFHHLFSQLLSMELARREPGLAPTLHRRASAWHRAHGTTEEAINHALAGGAFGDAAELIVASWPSYANVGRYATVLGWLERLPVDLLPRSRPLLLVQAWIFSMSARRDEAARAIAAVERLGALDDGPLPDGFSSGEASLAVLRGVFPWADLGAALENARRAAELEGPESPWRPVACFALGFALYFHGEFTEADAWFEECAALAPAREMWMVCGASLAYRSLIAREHGRLSEQQELADQAQELAGQHPIEDLDADIPLAVGAALAATGRFDEAVAQLDRSLATIRHGGWPIDLARTLLEQAVVLRSLGRHHDAAAAIAEARAIIASCPDPGPMLPARLAALDRAPRRRDVAWHDQLSERELTVLRLLSGSLSEREIGRELYLSHSTVHSHVRSIYRKLGVSSRAEAVQQARRLGPLARTRSGSRRTT
jgi:ATP/maltotriose-dependent transcriptional regulator MalT